MFFVFGDYIWIKTSLWILCPSCKWTLHSDSGPFKGCCALTASNIMGWTQIFQCKLSKSFLLLLFTTNSISRDKFIDTHVFKLHQKVFNLSCPINNILVWLERLLAVTVFSQVMNVTCVPYRAGGWLWGGGCCVGTNWRHTAECPAVKLQRIYGQRQEVYVVFKIFF